MATRQWRAKQVMQSSNFNKAAGFVVCEMANANIPYCLVGGLAVGYYSNPPVTPDMDFLLSLDIDAIEELVHNYRGWHTQPIWFPNRHQKGLPRRGVKLIKKAPFEAEVDLISTGGDRFLELVVKNAVPVRISQSLFLPIVSAEDLVVMKTLAAREKDADDVKFMYEHRSEMDRKYIDKWMKKLTDDKE
jgi:hypothetical protein